MKDTKKLGIFNFGAAILGVFWSFKNNCQNEYFVTLALSVFVVPFCILIAGVILIFIFVPAANLGSLAIALYWILGCGPMIFLFALSAFSIFVGFKANKWVIKRANPNEDFENIIERNDKWDKIAITVFLIGFFIIICSTTIPLITFDKKMHRTEEENCQILIETYQKLYQQKGEIFDKEDFVQILNSNPAVTSPAKIEEVSPVIYSTINNIPTEFKLRQIGECDINQQNCYVYVNNSACQFFFDKNGKIEMSQFTKEKYKNIKFE